MTSTMKKVLTIAAVAEAAMGVALIVLPSLVVRLLLGSQLAGVANPLARVAGIALLALGVACLPSCTALCGMLTYSVLATAYLFISPSAANGQGRCCGRLSGCTSS